MALSLLQINDALTALAQQAGIDTSSALAMLDDTTHLVADAFVQSGAVID